MFSIVVSRKFDQKISMRSHTSASPFAVGCIDVLGRLGWLSRVPADVRQAMLNIAHWRESTEGEQILQARDPEGGMIGIASGVANVSIAGGPPDAGSLHLLYPGKWTGYNPLLGRMRHIGLSARTTVHWALLPKSAVLHLLSENPGWWRHIAELASDDVELGTGAGADLTLRDPSRRIAAVLLRLAGCRHEEPLEQADVRITQDELAQMAASSRSTVNTVLQQFEAGGGVSLGYRDIVITNSAMLRRFADQI